MPVFDTPITTDNNSIDRVLSQQLPVVLYLFDQPNKTLDQTLTEAAEDFSGDLLFARVNVKESPEVHARFGSLKLPALLTFDEGAIESHAAGIRPADIDAHVDFLMGMGPKPLETTAEAEEKAATGAAPVQVTDANFQREVMESDIPVLVDFWAPWCGPCLMVAPVLDRLAEDYAGRVKIAKLNVDENQRTASAFRVRSIPTMIMFKNGEAFEQAVGAQPQPVIQGVLDRALA